VTPFSTIEDDGTPIPMVLVGAGAMGRHWLDALRASPDVALVGLVDLDIELSRRVVRAAGLTGVAVGRTVTEVARETGAQAVVNVTIPAAHFPVNVEALFGGLPVLCEKPIAPTVSQALALVAAAEASGQLLMTSQSRRYYKALADFRSAVGTLGRIGLVTTEFFRGPHFGGFRDEMDQPLLVDMAIHAFDAARYLLGSDPQSVRCETFNPEWSWYRGDAAAIASFDFDDGTRYLFNGSWCSPGLETSWNGSWRVSGSEGSATWDGEGAPAIERAGTSSSFPSDDAEKVGPEEIAGALAEFVWSLRTGQTPSGDVGSNIFSLAMVEAAVLSASSQARVVIDDVLEDAYEHALGIETRPEILEVLQRWGSATGGLAAKRVS
jgi:predicted dehydrogenase